MVKGGAGFAGGIVTLNRAELYDRGIVVATKVNGRGSIDGVGDQASFNLRATQSGDRVTGSLAFNEPAAGVYIARAKVRTLTFTDSSADFGGHSTPWRWE